MLTRTRRRKLVRWESPDIGSWYDLDGLDCLQIFAKGVYIIWRPPTRMRRGEVVYVGQGYVGQRLLRHKYSPKITTHGRGAGLLVTWASVPFQWNRDGIERFLAEYYNPVVGKQYPDVEPIAVNLPF